MISCSSVWQHRCLSLEDRPLYYPRNGDFCEWDRGTRVKVIEGLGKRVVSVVECGISEIGKERKAGRADGVKLEGKK